MKSKFLFVLALLAGLCALPLLAAPDSKVEKILELLENAPVKKIKSYIIKNRNLTAEKFGPNQNSILMEAIDKGRGYDVIKLLLDAGASPKAQNAEGDSAVTYAAKKSADQKVLDALISYDTVLPFQRKNRILKQNDQGKSALDYAKENGDQEQMQTINHYLGIVDVAEPQPSAEAAESPKAAESPEPVQEEAPVQNAQAPVTEEAVEAAAAATIAAPLATEALQEAAKAAAARAANPYKRVYLFEGIEAFDTYDTEKEKEKVLIAEPDKADANGRTLLHKAASQDDIEMILLLKESGANFNLADNDGYTPLMYCARFSKKIETLALLLSNGANAKAKNRYGLTAIEIAAADNKNPDIVAALLAKSQKADAKKAYVAAVGLGRPNGIIQKFFDGGMSPNEIYRGKSVLMYAAESNTHTNCIKLLLEKGADPTMLTGDYKDAFWFARQNPSLPKNDVYWSLNNSEKK